MRVRQLKTSEHEKVHIEQRLHELKKVPKHLAVILSINRESDVELSRLADLVAWALSSGVNFISFYDFKGTEIDKNVNAHKMTLMTPTIFFSSPRMQSHDELNLFYMWH